MPSSSNNYVSTLAPVLQALTSDRPSDQWTTAAVALLRLSPRECDAIGVVFELPSCEPSVRGYILDMLAKAGTFEAQVVMRRLLSLAVARSDCKVYASWVQRLAAVEDPDGPTLRFLMSVYFESKNELHTVRAACAYALGAAAGQANKTGDVDAAIRATDVLRRDLRDATTPNEKCALATALGNAGLALDIGGLLQLTADEDDAVRAAATLALRKMGTLDTRRALVAMLADRERKVAESAITALSEQHLEIEEIERLAELVLAGRTSLDLDARMLTLLCAQRARASSLLEKAIRLLVGRLEAPPSVETQPRLPKVSGERPVVSRSTRPFASSYSVVASDAETTMCAGDPNPYFVPR